MNFKTIKTPHYLATYRLFFPNTFCIYISQPDDYEPEEPQWIGFFNIVEKFVSFEERGYALNSGLYIIFEDEKEMWEFWREYCLEEICPYAVMMRKCTEHYEALNTYRDDPMKHLGILVNENT